MNVKGRMKRMLAQASLVAAVALGGVLAAPPQAIMAANYTTLQVDYLCVREQDDTIGDDEPYLIVFGGWRNPDGTAGNSGTWSVAPSAWNDLGSGECSDQDVTVTTEHSGNRIYAVAAMDRDDGNDFGNSSAARYAIASFLAQKFAQEAVPGRTNQQVAAELANWLEIAITMYRTNDDMIANNAQPLVFSGPLRQTVVWNTAGNDGYQARFSLTN